MQVRPALGPLSARYLSALQAGPLKEYNLSANVWRVLSIIARFEPMSATDVVHHTSLPADKVTRSINVLVDSGMVDRITDPDDRRRIIVSLTRPGSGAFRRISECGLQYEAGLLSVLSGEEAQCLGMIIFKRLAQGGPPRTILSDD